MSSASGNVITYHVPPPGSYTENAGFVHRTGDTMDSGAEIEFAGAGGKITGLRTSDIGAPMDAVNVEWYDSDVEERLEELQGRIEDGSIVAGHAAWADDAAHADDADWADAAGDALRALYANNAGHANDADNADYATSAGSASRADRATRADNADHADKADWAELAENVTNLPEPPDPPTGGGASWSLSGSPGTVTFYIKNSSDKTLAFKYLKTP
ncbi:MAG TPA: hypothetical protein PLA80_06320, partial [Synergistaceae bacterium]|nr:hypothetical protein [Synergistaceae bacterium]